MHTLYILCHFFSSKHIMFQTALGPMHPGNCDGIDAQVLTRFTVALLLGKVEKTNYL
jgi:hypothetical protein